jgi:hypothetical protein
MDIQEVWWGGMNVLGSAGWSLVSIPCVSTALQTGGIEYCQVFGDSCLHSELLCFNT